MESLRPLADIQIKNANASGNSQMHIGDTINNYAAQQAPAPVPAFSTVPFQRDQNFVPRGSILEDVEKTLSAAAGRAALCGLGGVGKSQLAIEYSFQVRSRYPDKWVFWIYASTAERLQTSVLDNLKQLDLEGLVKSAEDVFKIFQRWLRDARNGRWLIILDNVDSADILETAMVAGDVESILEPRSWSGRELLDNLATSDHGSILVTTRSRRAAVKVVEFESCIIDVKPMDDAQSMLFLKTKLSGDCSDGEAARLASALDHLPLAMAQAAAYIKARGGSYTVQQYLDALHKSESSRNKELKRDWADPRRHKEAQNSITLTWQISFEHIRKVRSAAADLLSLMSFFDRQAIPRALIKDMTSPSDWSTPSAGDVPMEQWEDTPDVTDEGSEVSFACSDQSESDSSSSNGSDAAKEAFDEAIGTLIDYSFVSRTSDHAVFEMHRLVQMSTQAWIKKNNAFERWASQFVANLSDAFPTGAIENWTVCRQLLPHAMLALEVKLCSRDALIAKSLLLHNAGRFASEQGSYALAVTFKLASLALYQGLYDGEHEYVLISMSDLATTYWNQGRWKEAEELEVKVLEASRRVLGAEHVDTLIYMNNLGSTYRIQGRWKEAEELQVKVLEARRRVLGAEHVDTLMSMNNLALTYADQGRWKEAEELEVKALEARRRVLSEEHLDTLISMANLASTYWAQGRWKEAEELQVEGLETERRVLGAEHPGTLISTSRLADILRSLEQHDAAVDILEQAANLSAIILGDEHRYTIQRFKQLAEWVKQDLERNTAISSGPGGVSNEDHDGVTGATDDDDEALKSPRVGDDAPPGQSSAPKPCLLNPSTIALLQSMGIHRISGLPDSA
ncbi:hypothetical protein LTR95_013305 [Oleoguttula sp. CCFEE 5521]